MVTMLVCNTRTFSAELDMNAVAVSLGLEELACQSDRGGIRVFGIMDAFRPSQSPGRIFAYTRTCLGHS